MGHLATALLVGTTLSSGMGESPGFEGKLEAKFLNARIEILASSSDKYTGAGYIFRPQLDLELGPAFLGAAYSWRNGGNWEKQVLWARGGFNFPVMHGQAWQLYAGPQAEMAVKSRNREMRGLLSFRLDWHDLRLETQTSYTSHLQGHGLGLSAYMGVTF